MKLSYLTILLSALMVLACQVKPKAIAYGEDGCHFCKMTIVDKQHAAEIVTVKGKVFKYDAIECMLNHLKDWDHPEVAIYLASDYSNPGELVDAQQAHYLVSKQIPSPMGEFLTAFQSEEERDQTKNKLDGQPFNWEELKTEFNVTH